MNSPIGSGGPEQPILTPFVVKKRQFPSLGLNRLPAAAAPVAVTLVGGVALVVAMGAWLGGQGVTENVAAPVEAVIEEAAAAEPTPKAAEPTPKAEIAAVKDEAVPAEAAVETVDTATEQPAVTEVAKLAEEPAGDSSEMVAEIVDEPIAETASDLIGSKDVGAVKAQAFASVAATDPGLTAAIPPASPGAFVPDVAVAESEEEIAVLEARQSNEVAEDLGDAPADDLASATEDDTRLSSATATKWVNMRNGPADEAEVLVVVPALAEIKAETGCEWCAVTYEGKAGFIYKTFISYEENEAVSEEAAAVTE